MFRGFFNRMYNGNPNRPDVDPGDMPKNRFELFFTTLGLRFGDLIKLNLIFLATILPVLLWTVFNILVIVKSVPAQQVPNMVSGADMTLDSFMQYFSVYLLFLLVLFPLAGPPLAGLTYIARNYAKDEHAWLWSDFKEQMKANWKQSAAVMFLLAVIFYVSFVTLQFYGITMGTQKVLYLGIAQFGFNYTASSTGFMGIMNLLFILFVALFVSSYMYMFPMLVTYKLRIGQIIRNSLMLALGRLPFTILFAIFTIFPLALGIFLTLYTGFALLGLVIYYLLFGFSLAAFVINSYTNATFERLLKTEEDANSDISEDNDKEVKP